MYEKRITVTVNGDLYTRTVKVNRTLLEFIREELFLTGTKKAAMGESAAPAPFFSMVNRSIHA